MRMSSVVDPAAEGPGDQPDRHADARADRQRDDADQQRVAGAVDDAAELVAAELVQAERELTGRPRELSRADEVEPLEGRVVRREQRREDRHEARRWR